MLIAVRKELCAIPQPSYASTAEDLWLTLPTKQCSMRSSNNFNLNVCVVYLCRQNLGLSFSIQLNNFLSRLEEIIISKPNDKYLIIGDFNMSGISWRSNSSESFLTPIYSNNNDEHSLVDMLHTLNLNQYNGIENEYGRILDLILSDDIVTVSECEEPLVVIDPHHKALCIEVKFFHISYLKPAARKKLMFYKGDYDKINTEIAQIDWIGEFGDNSLEVAVNSFYSILNNIINKHVPSKLHRNDRYPIWYTAALKKVIKEKYKYFKKFKKYGNLSDRSSYHLLRDRVKKLESECYSNYINSVEQSIKINPKYFWKFVKSRSNFGNIPSTINYGTNMAIGGGDICELFSDYFFSTFLQPSQYSPTYDLENGQPVSDISSVVINQEVLIKLIKNLDLNKTAGPDQIPSVFLVNCAEAISTPITLLFKKSLSECVVPSIWKSAFITPVHKKGPRTEVTNYRPVSKLCIIAKLFEKIIHTQLYAALKNNFNESQHGFVKGKSTVSNLILLDDFITSSMGGGKQVDVVYTDYSKCFDRIDHSTLILKLGSMGIRGDLLRWLTSYISNRSQAVVIQNYISSWVTVPSGVPQGSLLGPLLFVIFVSDIEKCFHHSRLLCFADDMKIYASISSQADVQALQSDLERLDNYCMRNKLDLNPSKCSVVTYSRSNRVIPSKYLLKGQTLVKSNKIRDLGVVYDSKLLFDEHIDSIVKKASQALGFVMRISSSFKEAKTLKILYCSFVRSILEYGSQIWNPRYDKYINRLENIQRKFIKYLCYRTGYYYKSNDYLNICAKFHLLPLCNRRKIADVIFLLKIISGRIICPELLSKIGFNTPTKAMRHYAPLHLSLVSSNYRQNTFLWRASKTLNLICKTHDIDIFNANLVSVRRLLSRDFFVDC